MASIKSKSCVNSADDFYHTDRQTIALLCGHNICLNCLACLKASDSPVCPQCRQSFAKGELPDSFGFITIWNTEQGENVKETNKVVGDKVQFIGCEVHQEPFVFWSNTNMDFYCTQCIVTLDLKTRDLKRVQDAIPLIRKDLQAKAEAVSRGLTSDLTDHKNERKEAVQDLENIKQFQEELQKLSLDFEDFIQTVDYHNFRRGEELDSVKKIEEEIETIKSADDIASMVKYKRTLDEMQISSQATPKTRPDTFLREVACTYAEEGGQKVSFIKKLRKKKTTKPKHRTDGNLTKMDAFILRCMEIRQTLFMAFFKTPHRSAIQM